MAGTVVSVIFNISSSFHEIRPIAVRIAKSGSSMNIKSYQLIASMIGLSTLLAQILFSINWRSGTSSAARLWSLTRRRTGFEHLEYSPPASPTDCRPGQPHPWSARFHDGCLYRRFFHYRCVHVVFGTSTLTPTILKPEGEFAMTIRAYGPREELIKGDWSPPPVKIGKGSTPPAAAGQPSLIRGGK